MSHHAASESSQSVLLTLILLFTALVYLRGWFSLRSSRVENISALRALSFLVGMFLSWLAVASLLAGLDHSCSPST